MSLQVTVLFSVLSLVSVYALAADSGRQRPKDDKDILMRCMYIASADTTTAADSAPTESLGFKFSVQKNNENHIAVDTFVLNENRKPIKQISHAELVSSAVSVKAKPSEIISQMTLAEDSPFDFDIAFNTVSETVPMTAVVNTLTTFTGQTYTNLNTQCQLSAKPEVLE